MTTNHKPATALPWYQTYRNERLYCELDTGDLAQVVEAENEQDAAYIELACNKYPLLVETLRALIKAEDEYGDPSNVAVNQQWSKGVQLLRDLGEES